MTVFVDANHAHCLVTRRSITGVRVIKNRVLEESKETRPSLIRCLKGGDNNLQLMNPKEEIASKLYKAITTRL